MNQKTLLLFLALSGLLLFSASRSVTLFQGEHVFVGGGNVDCTSCHGDVAASLSQSAYHASFDCGQCHSAALGGGSPHAATTVECSTCHSSAPEELNYTYEAHRYFYEAALGSALGQNYTSRGANEACIACHTTYSGRILFKYPRYLDINVSGGRNWEVSIARGPERTYGSTGSTGSMHTWVNKTQIDCTICHSYVKEGILNITLGRKNHTHVPDSTAILWERATYDIYPPHDPRDAAGNLMVPIDNKYCLGCHRPVFTQYHRPIDPGQVHAAVAISCLDCHDSGGVASFTHRGGLFAELWTKPLKTHADTCLGCHHTASDRMDLRPPVRYRVEKEPGGLIIRLP